MNVRNLILVPAALTLWACAAQAAAPGTAWTVRQNFPVGRDCRVNASAGDAQGNLYLVGSIDNGNDEDYFVAKVDGATDSLVWTSVYNGPDNNIDQATGCSLDSMGNLYVTGFSHNGTDFDVLTIKYDAATGAMDWVKRYNTGVKTNEYASSCAADRFGNLIVAGTCNEDTLYEAYNHEEYHVLAVKYDGADGDTIWSRHLDLLPDSLNEANDCCVDDSGNAYLSGYSALGLVLRLNSTDGEIEWVKRLSQAEGVNATCCAIQNGDLYVAGLGISGDYFAMKLKAAGGDAVWTRNIVASGMVPFDCGLGSDSSLITVVSGVGYEYKIIKYDIDTGDTLWARTYPHKNSNTLRSLVLDEPGVVTVLSSGEMGEYPGQLYTGMFAAKYSVETGYFLDSCSYGQSNPGGGWNFAYDCAVAGNNGPVVVGSAGSFYAAIMHDPSDGHLVWEKRDPDGYDPQHTTNSKATGVVQGGDHLYITGHTGTAGELTYKFDIATGDSLWAAYSCYGLSHPGYGNCVLDQLGNLFVTANGLDGYLGGYYANPNSIIVKLDIGTGDTLWTLKNFTLAWSNASTVDSFGAFYNIGPSNVTDGYTIVKHKSTTGDTLWSRAFNLYGTGPDDAQDAFYSNGYLYLVGATYNGSDLDYFLAKHDTAVGDTVWCRLFDSPFGLEDRALSCAADDSGFIYLTGSSHNGSDYDIWTMKCTPEGDSLWSIRYNGPDGKNDFGRGCCVDSLGNLYVTGFSATGRGYDMVTIKYNTGYTGVGSEPGALPAGKYSLGPAYPNPSRGGRITIKYDLPSAGRVTASVYNIAGQLVRKLDQGRQPGGSHQMVWDGNDRNGARAATGVYLLQCDLGGLSATRKVLVVR